MNKKIILVIFSVILISNLSYGQETDSGTAYRNIGIKGNYFGEFVLHPGFTGGIYSDDFNDL